MAKKFFVIDNRQGEMFGNEQGFETMEQATKEAEKQWQYLTESEKKNRDEFFVAFGGVDEDGCLELDTADIIKAYKQDVKGGYRMEKYYIKYRGAFGICVWHTWANSKEEAKEKFKAIFPYYNTDSIEKDF